MNTLLKLSAKYYEAFPVLFFCQSTLNEWYIMNTANSIKVVFSKALTVNYEHSGDDGLLLILFFPDSQGITFS